MRSLSFVKCQSVKLQVSGEFLCGSPLITRRIAGCFLFVALCTVLWTVSGDLTLGVERDALVGECSFGVTATITRHSHENTALKHTRILDGLSHHTKIKPFKTSCLKH